MASAPCERDRLRWPMTRLLIKRMRRVIMGQISSGWLAPIDSTVCPGVRFFRFGSFLHCVDQCRLGLSITLLGASLNGDGSPGRTGGPVIARTRLREAGGFRVGSCGIGSVSKVCDDTARHVPATVQSGRRCRWRFHSLARASSSHRSTVG